MGNSGARRRPERTPDGRTVRRPHVIRARASDEEKQVIDAAAAGAGMATGAWLIRLDAITATGGSWRPQRVAEATGRARALWVQQRRIGTNLNQLARAFNATGEAPELTLLADTLKQVYTCSLLVEQAVDELVGELRRSA